MRGNMLKDFDEININIAPFGLSLESIGIILGIIFTVLKGCGIGVFATWSWFWCTFPFWIVVAVEIGLVILGAVCAGIALGITALVEYIKNKKENK